jgi:acetyl esterase/lipase
MFAGSVEAAKTSLSQVVSRTGVKIFSIDYRLAPEHPHPAPVEGCYSGLHFVSQNAQRLGVDPARIAAMGESAGGGLAAATALLAQDRELKPKLAKQILVSPSSTIALLKPLWRMESF